MPATFCNWWRALWPCELTPAFLHMFQMLHSFTQPVCRVDKVACMRRTGPWGTSLLPASVSRQCVPEARYQTSRHQSDTSRPPHSYRPKITSDFVVKTEQRAKAQRTTAARVRKSNQTAGAIATDVAVRVVVA